jgi:hypothetical protein
MRSNWRGDETEVRTTVTFRNLGEHPIWILKPLDGSTDGRLMPLYELKITDSNGKALKHAGYMCIQCGVWAHTKWPQDYLVELRPGATFEISQDFRGRNAAAGHYAIQFKYEYLPREQDFAPPVQAWRGRVETQEVVVEYEPTPVPEPAELGPPKDPDQQT